MNNMEQKIKLMKDLEIYFNLYFSALKKNMQDSNYQNLINKGFLNRNKDNYLNNCITYLTNLNYEEKNEFKILMAKEKISISEDWKKTIKEENLKRMN